MLCFVGYVPLITFVMIIVGIIFMDIREIS